MIAVAGRGEFCWHGKVRYLLSTLLLLSATCIVAQARPRDEVMSGAYRCAVIGDTRQWLDCYYGAAQPARAALGMAPAPAAQVALVSRPPAGPAAPGEEAVRDRVMASATGCAVTNDRQWLDCYYAAAQPMRDQLHLSPAPQAKIAPPPPPPTQPPMFPVAHPVPEAGAMAGRKQMNVRMTSYSFAKTGYFTVTLDNGQTWRQIDGDTDFAHWKKPASSYQVRITEGFLRSYNLQVKGLPGLYKVALVP